MKKLISTTIIALMVMIGTVSADNLYNTTNTNHIYSSANSGVMINGTHYSDSITSNNPGIQSYHHVITTPNGTATYSGHTSNIIISQPGMHGSIVHSSSSATATTFRSKKFKNFRK